MRIYLTGWLGYFGFCQTPSVHPTRAGSRGDPGVLRELHQWLRRRLRAIEGQEAFDPIREANAASRPRRRLEAMAQWLEPVPAAFQTGRTAPARVPNRGQRARSPPRSVDRVHFMDRIDGLLAIDGRIAASPALNIALSNAELAALGLPIMQPRAA